MGVLDVFNILPSWVYGMIILVLAVYLYGIWPYLTNTIKLPGPKPTAFVGNIIEINTKGVIQYDIDCVKKYGKVYLTWAGRFSNVCVSDPDMIKQITIKDFANFTNRPIPLAISKMMKNAVSVIEDDHWKFVRSILTPAFSSGKMRGMVPLIHTCIDNLLYNFAENCESGKSFDLKRLFGAYTIDVIAATGFGMDAEAQKNPDDLFLKMAKRPFELQIFQNPSVLVSFLFPFLIPVLEAIGWVFEDKVSSKYFVELLSKTIHERKAKTSTRKDILQLMLDNNLSDLHEAKADGDVDIDMLKIDNLTRGQKLTDDEVISQAFIFLLAGYETTGSTMSFIGYNLALNQDCQDKLIDEIDNMLKGERPTYNNVMGLPYLEMCMAETLRVFPILTQTNRLSRDETVINGLHLPSKSIIVFPVYAIHHDPENWPQPEKFDPERFSPEEKAKRNPYIYLPFGLGPRNCVGRRLAQLEAKMAIAAILQKFRFIRSLDTEVPLKLKKGQFAQPENGIWLKLESRLLE